VKDDSRSKKHKLLSRRISSNASRRHNTAGYGKPCVIEVQSSQRAFPPPHPSIHSIFLFYCWIFRGRGLRCLSDRHLTLASQWRSFGVLHERKSVGSGWVVQSLAPRLLAPSSGLTAGSGGWPGGVFHVLWRLLTSAYASWIHWMIASIKDHF
jgi:hypothetical protein